MKIPQGLTESYVLEKIRLVANRLAPDFVFGYNDVEDIQQEVFLLVVEPGRDGTSALDRYDTGGIDPNTGEPRRPLENFLSTHCYNRLCNFIRNKFHRNDSPCKLCHEGRQNEHEDGRICDIYRAWKKVNHSKASLMQPVDLESQEETSRVGDLDHDLAMAELRRKIDEHLPAELRTDYRRLCAQAALPKGRRAKVEKAVREILGFNPLD